MDGAPLRLSPHDGDPARAMGLSATSDLALDLRPPHSSPALPAFLREAAAAAREGRAKELEAYIQGLEEERRKIEGFRRELPLCMLLLNDVIEAFKGEMRRHDGRRGPPVLEELMPLGRKFQDKQAPGEDDLHGVDLMSSVPLWSDNSSTDTSSSASVTVAPTANNVGSSASSRKSHQDQVIGVANEIDFFLCGSSEFVAALEHLGGARVATPKQIRELMKVDGLTNDEVKSHLQKYQLHTRKMPPASRSVVIFGGLCVAREGSQSVSPKRALGGARRVGGADDIPDAEEDGNSESSYH